MNFIRSKVSPFALVKIMRNWWREKVESNVESSGIESRLLRNADHDVRKFQRHVHVTAFGDFVSSATRRSNSNFETGYTTNNATIIFNRLFTSKTEIPFWREHQLQEKRQWGKKYLKRKGLNATKFLTRGSSSCEIPEASSTNWFLPSLKESSY